PPPPPSSTLFPYTTLFRSVRESPAGRVLGGAGGRAPPPEGHAAGGGGHPSGRAGYLRPAPRPGRQPAAGGGAGGGPSRRGALPRSEEHTSELQSRFDLVCR